MSKCWYCNEELTTGNSPEHIGICDKCYNSMFKVGNDFVKTLIDKIADLETKLASSEKAYEDLKEIKEATKESLYASRDYLEELTCKTWELEKQLAESEDKNKKLKDEVRKSNVGITHLKNQLKQTKEKLAEKDEEINDICQNYDFQLNDFSKEVYRLQQREKVLEKQLVEKDNEIKKLNFEAQKYFEDAYCNDVMYQDKISFAVEQLEKVKYYAQHIQGGLIDYIDNQIKEIKGE